VRHAGQFLGRVGDTGWTVGSCLHFEVHINDNAIDPLAWLESNVFDPDAMMTRPPLRRGSRHVRGRAESRAIDPRSASLRMLASMPLKMMPWKGSSAAQ
jgi:murein DD-endopeptidase MepM/ murein hydrolase activator NlpD